MRFASSLVVFTLLAVWAGCSSDDTTAGPVGTADAGTDGAMARGDAGGDVAAPASLKPYQIVGRYDSRDAAGPRFGWPGTKIIAKFTGDKVSVDLSDTTGEDQFEWSVDGSKPTLLAIDTKEKKTYELASGLAAGAHELVLTKRTESSVGESQLFAINATLTGTPAPAGRRIEMVGDSITAGYGVLGPDEHCTFSPETEDESEAWGALAASQLTAVHTAIAWSGIGLVQNYEGATAGNMPELYPRALATDTASTWTASDFEPDVIVIALGTNDLGGQGADPGETFQTTLVTFLTTIRTAHPSSQIVLATSPMLTDQNKADQTKYFEGAIAARATAGDKKLSFLDIPAPSAGNGFGCDFHPSAKTQQDMAAALVPHLKTLMGW